MAKFALAWLVLYVGGLVASFVHPVYGLLAYLLEYYLRPSLHWWGKDLPDLRYSLTAAVVLLVSYAAKQGALPRLTSADNPALKWLLALCGVMIVVTFTVAADTWISWDMAFSFLKFTVVYLLIVAVVRTEWTFDLFAAMHMAGAAWWGWEAFLDPKRRAGRLLSVGSGDTLNDNDAAGHLLTVLPFVAVYLFGVKDRRLKLIAFVSGPLVANTFILCNSRGATLGLLAAAVTTFFIVKRRDLPRVAAIGVLGAMVFFSLADPVFIARQKTTANYEEQGTAQSRLIIWSGGLRMLRDHPLGSGGRGFNIHSHHYLPDSVQTTEGLGRSPHNTWVLVAAEWGLLGFILYLAFIASTFRMLRKVRLRAPPSDALYYRALAVQVGLVGTLAASTFSDRLYGESIYWLCGLAVALYRIQSSALENGESHERPSASAPAAGTMHQGTTPRPHVA